jgi:hypothetical protein
MVEKTEQRLNKEATLLAEKEEIFTHRGDRTAPFLASSS